MIHSLWAIESIGGDPQTVALMCAQALTAPACLGHPFWTGTPSTAPSLLSQERATGAQGECTGGEHGGAVSAPKLIALEPCSQKHLHPAAIPIVALELESGAAQMGLCQRRISTTMLVTFDSPATIPRASVRDPNRLEQAHRLRQAEWQHPQQQINRTRAARRGTTERHA